MPDESVGRSGLCWEDTYPRMHRACSGFFTRLSGLTGTNEPGRCSCLCHVVGISGMTWLPGRVHRRRAATVSGGR
jgi:hypothetical protein